MTKEDMKLAQICSDTRQCMIAESVSGSETRVTRALYKVDAGRGRTFGRLAGVEGFLGGVVDGNKDQPELCMALHEVNREIRLIRGDVARQVGEKAKEEKVISAQMAAAINRHINEEYGSDPTADDALLAAFRQSEYKNPEEAMAHLIEMGVV
jgi:hypothetical protein